MNATDTSDTTSTTSTADATDTADYRRGLKALENLEGCSPPSILEALADIAPGLGTMVVTFVYGQLYARPDLHLRHRQLVTIAALAAMGNARPQLKFHVGGALQAGCTPLEVVETMVHLAVYAGFPVALNAVFAVQEVLREKGLEPLAVDAVVAESCARDRFAEGWKVLQQVDGHGGEAVIASLAGVAPDLGRFIIEFAFGDVYTRPGLGLLERELVTIAALAAMGTGAPQLRVHLHGFLNVGGSREQMVEALIHIAAYAGFPAAINGMTIAREVLAERDRRPG